MDKNMSLFDKLVTTQSVSTRTPFTSTTFAFYNLALFEINFRHPAYAASSELFVTFLNALQTTQLFIPLFLPFRYQNCICEFLSEAELIKVAGDFFLLVEKVEDVL